MGHRARWNNLMSLSFVKIEDFNKITRFQIANSWLVLPNFCCTFHPSSSWKSQRLPEPFGSYTFCVLCSIPVIHLSLAVLGSVVSIPASETVELKKGNTSSSLKPFACNVGTLLLIDSQFELFNFMTPQWEKWNYRPHGMICWACRQLGLRNIFKY